MDEQSVAESLPERYRAVLDRVADLESSGRHAEADEVRRQAIRAYSRAWNARTAKRLDALAAQAIRLLDEKPSSRRRSRLGFAWLTLEGRRPTPGPSGTPSSGTPSSGTPSSAGHPTA